MKVITMIKYLLTGSILALTACAEQVPLTPQMEEARKLAVIEITQSKCSSYLGGFGDAKELVLAKNRQRAKALATGATEANLAQALSTLESQFSLHTALSGVPEVCGQYVAWSGTISAESGV